MADTKTDWTAKDVEREFGSLLGCCLHSPAWTPVDVDYVLCAVQRQSGGSWSDMPSDGKSVGSESESYLVAVLKDGFLGLLAESEDYTGHGCQCSSSASSYGNADDLLQLGIEEYSGARDAIELRLRRQRWFDYES